MARRGRSREETPGVAQAQDGGAARPAGPAGPPGHAEDVAGAATAAQRSYGNRIVGRSAQVQALARGGLARTPREVRSEAEAGVRGQGGPLPHLDKLGPLFGGHDLRGVEAFTDGGAREACRTIGAEAYATGEKVAFAQGSPDLRTAAHEAAHVVQQRAGLELDEGVGAASDVHEVQAERVAEAVTGGRSAAVLLGAPAQRAGGRAAPVQRLASRAEFRAQAGAPTAHSLGGYKQHSKRYRALLEKLEDYERVSAQEIPPVVSDQHNLRHAKVRDALAAVKAACDEFVARYEGLTGIAAYRDRVERGRLGHVKALRASVEAETPMLAQIQGEARYVGMTYRDAVPRGEFDRQVEMVSQMILGLPTGQSTIEDVRDTILGLDDIAVKQALLRDEGLREFIRDVLSPTEALIIAGVLLDRALTWWDGSGPDPKQRFKIKAGGDFSLWILGRDENGPHKPDLRAGTMNCWEGVLFSMYVSGVVTYATLRDMHERATADAVEAHGKAREELAQNPELLREKIIDRRMEHMITHSREEVEAWYEEKIKDDQAQKDAYRDNAARGAGNDAYYGRLARNLGAHGAREWKRGDDPPPLGDVVFFTGKGADKVGEKWRIAHVCISLGRKNKDGETDIMNFGVSDGGGHTIWGCSTIEEGLAHKYGKGYIVMYGPSGLLKGEGFE